MPSIHSTLCTTDIDVTVKTIATNRMYLRKLLSMYIVVMVEGRSESRLLAQLYFVWFSKWGTLCPNEYFVIPVIDLDFGTSRTSMLAALRQLQSLFIAM